MVYVGGLRDRLIIDNLRNYIYDSLNELGWFGAGRQHQSVSIRTEPVGNRDQIVPNVVAISEEDVFTEQAELGSNLTDFRWTYAIDIYAESLAVGRHLTGDVRAIIEGRFSSIGQTGKTIDIYDLTQATPTVIFTVEVESVEWGKQREYSHPWQQYWWTIMFDLVDTYGDEDY